MKMVLALLLASALAAQSATNLVLTNWNFTNLQGRIFSNTTLRTATPTNISVAWEPYGYARIDFTNLPDDIRQMFHYDPEKARQWTEAEANRKQEALARQRDEQIAAEIARRAFDWPEWRGPARNGTGKSKLPLAAAWPPGGPPKLWTARELPNGGSSSPVIANGRVYAYIHQREERKDTVVCLDEVSGAKQWQKDILIDRVTLHDASGSPCVTGNVCLVMGARDCYALNATTGALLWKTVTGVPATDPAETGKGQEVNSSFAALGRAGVVICGPAFGIDLATGSVLWKAPEPGGWADSITSVAVWRGSHVIYGGKWRLCCVEARSGRLDWELPGTNNFTTYGLSPAVLGDVLIAFHRGELRAFDLASGSPIELWHIPYGEEYASPVVDSDRVYTTSPDAIYLDGVERSWQRGAAYKLTCRELRSGKVVWQEDIANALYSSPILVNDQLFVLTDNGAKITMFDSRDGRLLATMAVGATAFSSPSIANGRLFVRVSHGIACYDLAAHGNAEARISK